MKSLFDREELLQKLKKAGAFVPKKAIIAAHEAFLFKIGGNRCSITSTDGNKQMTIFCDVVKHDGDAMFTVPAKLIIHVLSLLIEKEVNIISSEGSVQIKCGKAKYNMPSESGAEYPLMKNIPANFEASFNGNAFSKAIEITKEYADPDNASPALQGVCLRAGDDNSVNFYGCNSHHAAKIVVRPRSLNKWADIIVPASTITAVMKCINDEDIVDVTHDQERIEIKTDSVLIMSSCFAVKYPKIELFFDTTPEHFVEVNTLQFLHVLQRLDVFSPKEVPLISLDIKTASMVIQTADSMFNHDAEEEIDMMAEQEIKFAVNIKLLTNIIVSFTNDTFKMRYESFDKAIHIEPVNIAKDNDMFFVVMPCKI